jgi:uncharacterized membrane protein YoaK (UPF0700 family)
LSLAAGSLDVTGFLGLGGLFTAHITGNLVVLAARLAVHEPSPLSHAISVPVSIMILILTRLFVAGLDRIAVPSLLPLLVLQFLFLLVALSVSLAAGRQADPYGPELTLVSVWHGRSKRVGTRFVDRFAVYRGDDHECERLHDGRRRNLVR